MENRMLAVSKIHLILIFTNICKRNFVYNRGEPAPLHFFPQPGKVYIIDTGVKT